MAGNLLVVLVTAVLTWPFTTRAEEEMTWYVIEIIVFERTSEAARDGETWPVEPGLPDLADAVELSEEGIVLGQSDEDESSSEPAEAPTDAQVEVLVETPAAAPDMPRAFQLVPPEEYRLTGAWERLDASGAYRPLLHLAWIQPGLSTEDAQLVHVRNDNAALGSIAPVNDQGDDQGNEQGSNESGDQDSGGVTILQPASADLTPGFSPHVAVARDPSKVAVDGTVRVHRARYLHFLADLLYYRPIDGAMDAMLPPTDEAQSVPDSPDIAFTEQLLAEEQAAATVFRLTESRRMRSRELHYLDHPLFGVLVQAWPLELPEAPQLLEAPAGSAAPADEAGSAQPPAESQDASGG